VAEDRNSESDRGYRDIEKKTIDAFDRWHRFHEDLLKLGDFSNWLSESENRVDLVTFFALDKEHAESYRKALAHQKMFLAAMGELLEQIEAMFDEYQSAHGDKPGEAG
jgi:hypothetical protein